MNARLHCPKIALGPGVMMPNVSPTKIHSLGLFSLCMSLLKNVYAYGRRPHCDFALDCSFADPGCPGFGRIMWR